MEKFGKLLLLVLLTGCCVKNPPPVDSFTENRYIPAEDFLRIGQYLTGEAPKTDRLYLRSQEGKNGGYYWIFPVEDTLADSPFRSVSLEVQIPGSPVIQEFSFAAPPELTTSNTLWIGLTGDDWPGPRYRPIAWRIQFLSGDGEPLMTRENFLWKNTSPPIQPSSSSPTNEGENGNIDTPSETSAE